MIIKVHELLRNRCECVIKLKTLVAASSVIYQAVVKTNRTINQQ